MVELKGVELFREHEVSILMAAWTVEERPRRLSWHSGTGGLL